MMHAEADDSMFLGEQLDRTIWTWLPSVLNTIYKELPGNADILEPLRIYSNGPKVSFSLYILI